MRDIKFRGYHPDYGDQKMFYWDFKEIDIAFIPDIIHHAEFEHIMQYTGLKDKNGTLIYESDYVESDGEGKALVEWDNSFGSWVLVYLDEPNRGDHTELLGNCLEFELEVTGNKYES